jgi:fatty acid desaturase
MTTGYDTTASSSAVQNYSESEMRSLMLSRIDIREYTRIAPHKVFANIAFQWSIIGLTLAAVVWSGVHPVAYVLAMLVIVSRQHALGIIMHDGTHYRLLENRFWNNVVSDLFCAFPILMITNRYRHYHLLHHKNLNGEADPYWSFFRDRKDWHWPKTPRAALSVFLRDLLGLTAKVETNMILRWGPFTNHFSTRKEPPPLSVRERISFYVFAGLLMAGLWRWNVWLELLVLWIVPLLFLMMPLTRIRTVAEHIGIPGRTRDNATRHVDGSWLERVFISPCNINFHVAHHMFAGVPLYNLPRLHRRLLQEPEYRSHICHKDTYLGLDRNKGVLGEVLAQA